MQVMRGIVSGELEAYAVQHERSTGDAVRKTPDDAADESVITNVGVQMRQAEDEIARSVPGR